MRRKPLTRREIARIESLWRTGSTPLRQIAAEFGLSADTFRRYRREWGWPAQRPRPGPDASEQPVAATVRTLQPLAGEPAELDATALAGRVEAAVVREIDTIEGRLGSELHPHTERSARVLASLVKTLADLRRLEANPPRRKGRRSDDANRERPPRDLAALKADLVAKLDRLREGQNS